MRRARIIKLLILGAVLATSYRAISNHFDRRPRLSASAAVGMPSLTFERSLPGLWYSDEVAWTADSKRLIVATRKKLGFRIETVTGDIEEAYTLPYGGLYFETFSTHEVITTTYDKRTPFEAVDLRDGRVLFRGSDPDPRTPYGSMGNNCFATTKDRSVVAVGYGPPFADRPVTFYDTRTWEPQAQLTLPSPGPAKFWSIELSWDGKRIAYAEENAVTVVDVTSGAVVQRLPIPSSHIFAWSPDGDMLAIAERGWFIESNGYRHGIAVALHVVRLSDGMEIARREQARSGSVTAIEWDPLGRFLAYVDGQSAHLLRLSSDGDADTTVNFRSEVVTGLAISPDGSWMAVGDGHDIDLFRIGL